MGQSERSLLLAQGVLGLLVGVIAIGWGDVTIGAFVSMFAIFAIIGATLRLVRAASLARAGGQVALAVVDVAAAAVTILWPGMTAFGLTVVVALWALVTGTGELGMTFGRDESGWERARYLLAGLLAITFGALLLARPDIGEVSVAELFGLFSILNAITSLVAATMDTEPSSVRVV